MQTRRAKFPCWCGRVLSLVMLAALARVVWDQGAGTPAFSTFDYSELDEGQQKAVRLAIPSGMETIRGLLVSTNAAGGDTRDRYTLPWLRTFAALHGLAFVGAQAFNSHAGSVTVLQHALERWAVETGHPELANVPFVVYGFSAGGGFANRLLNTLPERVVASTPVSTAMRMDIPEAALAVPMCMFSGELEDRLNPLLTETMQTQRSRGAQWAWAMVEGGTHRELDQPTLALPFLDRCLRLRCPAEADPRQGPVVLKTLDQASGWLADNTSWRSDMTAIKPYADPGAAAATTSWLPNEDLAFLYRAYATFAPALKLTNPPSGATWVLRAGDGLNVTVDDSGCPGWRQMTLYNGAQQLLEITQGPARFMLADLQPGVYGLYVMATDAQGVQRLSRPAAAIVTPKGE